MNGHSEFYPQRARGPVFLRNRWFRLRRVLPDKIFGIQCEPLPVPPLKILLSLALPGYVFRGMQHPRIALALAVAYLLALLAYIYWAGYYASALAIMISIHVSCSAYLLKQLTPNFGIVLRLLSAFMMFAFLYGFVYKPASLAFGKLAFPLRLGENLVIVNGFAVPEKIKRGDWIAYRIRAEGGQGVAVRAGFGISPALAVPGDTVEFFPERFVVNGEEKITESFMPTNTTWHIAEKQWFVWPKVGIGGNQNNNPAISGVLQKCALLSEDDFVGKPYERWFWKRQILQ